jgi:urease accessory protein
MSEGAASTRVLRLLAWMSPAFPTGGFAYSHGLEWVIEQGEVKDHDGLRIWLEDILALGPGRTDAILLRQAYRGARDPATLWDIAELAAATATRRERLAEMLTQGAAFVRAMDPWGGPALPEQVAYAVAVGAHAGWHGIGENLTAAAFLQAFAANLISAAVRLVPLGQSTGLSVLAAIEAVILRTAQGTKAADLDDIGSASFRSDIAAMRHETQYTRLFRS